MTPLDVLRLVDIIFFSLPIVVASALLVFKTNQIRALQKRFKIQMVIFRDMLAVGYLFFAAGFFYVEEDVAEWFHHEQFEELGRIAFHAIALFTIIVITVSFFHYYRMMTVTESRPAEPT